MKTVAVIGGGAAGMMAAAAAASCGADVTLYEKNRRLGNKIYSTGNGRGNICNLRFVPENCYYSCETNYPAFLSTLHERFSETDLIRFFEENGLYCHDRSGYVYPRTDQASVIPEILEDLLCRKSVHILTGKCISAVRKSGEHFLCADSSGREETYDSVILAAGGSAAPETGSDGSGIRLASMLGAASSEVFPALTALLPAVKLPKQLAGVRTSAQVDLSVDGKTLRTEFGEVQFTREAVSGIPVLQLSHLASIAISARKETALILNFAADIPSLQSESQKKQEFRKRLEQRPDANLIQFAEGLVHPGVAAFAAIQSGLVPESRIRKYTEEQLYGYFKMFFSLSVPVTGVMGFDRAQVTGGGVYLSELSDVFEVRCCPGAFIVGETVDIDGICGGYNLYFAFAGGYIAGLAAGSENA